MSDNDKLLVKRHLNIEMIDVEKADWKSLHASRSETKKAADELLKKAEKAGSLTDTEKKAFDSAMSYLDKIQEEFNLRSAAGTREPLGDKPVRVVTDDGTGNDGVGAKEAATKRSFIGEKRLDVMFPGEARDTGFKNADEYYRVLFSRKYDPRLEAIQKRSQMIGVAALGGFAVPVNYFNGVYSLASEQSIVLPRAKVYPMQNMELQIAAGDDANHSASLFGGYAGVWTAEGDTGSYQEINIRALSLKAKKLQIYGSITNELVDAEGGFQSYMEQALGATIAFDCDEAFLWGNGVAKPLGAMNAGSSIKITRNTANDIKPDDIIGMVGRLHPALHGGAVWLASPSAYKEIIAMVDSANHYVNWTGLAGSGANATPATLLGFPVIVTEKMNELGTEGDLALVNFSQYAVGLNKVLTIDTSDSALFTSDKLAYRATIRVDGQPLLEDVITPRRGSTTLGWLVILS